MDIKEATVSAKEFVSGLQNDIDEVRDTLRYGKSKSLRRRRKITIMAILGMLDFAVITLYQSGILKHLPDLPFKPFDSDFVNGSETAYKMGVPDGATGASVYGTILVLALFGGKRGLLRSKLFDKLLFGAVAVNALGGLYYLYEMAFKQKRVCLYCLTGALLNFLMVPPARKELAE